MDILQEDTRKQLIDKSKSSIKGMQRYNRRVKSSVAKSTKQFNSIDMNNLFKNGILTVKVEVNGETDNYEVTIKFGNFIELLQKQIQRNKGVFDIKAISRALIEGFNQDNVFIHCSCPDWNYRFSYWSKVNGISADPAIEQPTNGKRIRNPNDTLGSGCKHSLLVLANNFWLFKVASVIKNYVTYMEHNNKNIYDNIIYPALYGHKQLSLIDEPSELNTEKSDIDAANKYAQTRTQFKPGNKYRFKPGTKEEEDQITFDL